MQLGQVRHENPVVSFLRRVVLPRLVVALDFAFAALCFVLLAFLCPSCAGLRCSVSGRRDALHAVVQQHLVGREEIHGISSASKAVEKIERWILVHTIGIPSAMVQGSNDRVSRFLPEGHFFLLQAAELVGLRLLPLQ